jgi:hypothetical protein
LAGELFRATETAYDGVLSFVGEVSRAPISIARSVVGAVTFAGDYLRSLVMERAKSGLLDMLGAVSGIKTVAGSAEYWIQKSGILELAGTLSASYFKETTLVSGVLGIIGRVSIIEAILKRLTDASISPAGALRRLLVTRRSALLGTLSLQGLARRRNFLNRTKLGALSLAGLVTNDTTGGIWNYTVRGMLELGGILSKVLSMLRTNLGSISPSGIASRLLALWRAPAGVLSLVGNVLGVLVPSDWNLGTLSFSGLTTPRLVSSRLTYSSILTVSGVVTRSLVLARTKTGVETFNGVIFKYKDILYYGPPNL